MIVKLRRIVLCVFLLLSVNAVHSAQLVVEGGILVGARNVNVNGQLFDVVFKDGTCAELYNGCDENTDFPFTNPLDLGDSALAVAAQHALLKQVFIDGPTGNFDTQPELTRGCTLPGCYIFTSYSRTSNKAYNSFWVRNRLEIDLDVVGAGSDAQDVDTRASGISTRAVWTRVAPVPEPSTWALMAIGLLGLGRVARCRSK